MSVSGLSGIVDCPGVSQYHWTGSCCCCAVMHPVRTGCLHSKSGLWDWITISMASDWELDWVLTGNRKRLVIEWIDCVMVLQPSLYPLLKGIYLPISNHHLWSAESALRWFYSITWTHWTWKWRFNFKGNLFNWEASGTYYTRIFNFNSGQSIRGRKSINSVKDNAISQSKYVSELEPRRMAS